MNLRDMFQKDALVEADLTQKQIQDLFQAIEAQARAQGDNRTEIGKGVDVAKKAATAVGRAAVAGAKKVASRVRPTPESLSEHEINKLMALIEAGMLDRARQSASNLVNRITADKLMKAWQQRGSPRDSDVIAMVLDTAGVPDNVVQQAYSAMNIPPPGSGPTPAAAPTPQPADPRVLDALAKLPTASIEAWISQAKSKGATDASPVIQAARDELSRRAGGQMPAAPAAAPAQQTAKPAAPAQPQAAAAAPTQAAAPAQQPAPQAAPAATPQPQAAAKPAAPAPAAPGTLSSGVSIISSEPIVIRYKNSDYGLNDQGQWALLKRPDRPVPQSFAVFLDKEHDKHLAGAGEAAAVKGTAQPRRAQAAATTPARPSWLQRMGLGENLEDLRHPDPKVQKEIEWYQGIRKLPFQQFQIEANKDPERAENARLAWIKLANDKIRSDQKAKEQKVGFVDMGKDYKGPPVPKIVYHGTMRANLHAIMKDGLKPKLNKWKYYNRWHGQHPSNPNFIPPTPEEKLRDTTLSVTDDIEDAFDWAVTGGGRAERSPERTRDVVVLAFAPVASDKPAAEEGMAGELVFRNTISPNRLKIVYPEKLKGKENQFLEKGATLTDFTAEKSAKMKEVNKQLKQAGSPYRIKSYKYAKPRWDVFAVDDTKGGLAPDWPNANAVNKVLPMNTPEFDQWLRKQLS